MPRPFLRRLTMLAVGFVCAGSGLVALTPDVASAHNSLLSSNPADGAVLTVSPSQIVWQFDKDVPLDTMTVTLVDATGVRTELTDSTHGPGGSAEVVTPLPLLPAGAASIRWRLVGPDGHPISGRIDLTITDTVVAAPVETTMGPTSDTATDTATDTGANTTPAELSAAVPPVTPGPPTVGGGSTDSTATSSIMRWLVRYASYLALMSVIGVLATAAFVWPRAGTHPLLQRILSGCLIATAVLGFVQLLQIAADIGDTPIWSSVGSIDAAMTTDAGTALTIRIALAAGMWVVLFRARIVHADVYWSAAALTGGGLLLTWALAGHSRSQRWPTVGVLADIVHHAAAAAWIAGLAVVAWIVIPSANAATITQSVRRFSRLAATCVALLVTTGIVQTARLVGNPARLFDAHHGRYLAAKLLLLVGMLAVASANHRRVDAIAANHAASERGLGLLRRAIVSEFAIGVAMVGITAAMVVSPPAIGA